MHPFVRPLAQTLSLAALLASSASAQTHPVVDAKPQTRILSKIDTADLTHLAHTTTDRIARATDLGRVPADTRFTHMLLVLKSTDAQEFALAGLLDQQQDKSSTNYHQWMTPDTFATTFGPTSTDLAQITAWLQDSGFTVDHIVKGGRILQFSGTSAQVESAFHTQMHTWLADGQTHIANATDISIPAALADVVLGIASLNDFRPTPHLVNPRTITPDYTSPTTGTHYVGAADLATLFNTKPLLASGIDGTGVTIGIIGQTDILLSDVQIYRTLFNLPQNDPTFTLVGSDPGTISDDGESDLDVELSGALAPGASINFVTSGNSYFGGGIDAAAVYLVENNSADIISLSYGLCEASLGANGNAFYNLLWEQAASQGQTVFVSSGDSGPSTCNSSAAAYSTTGYGVNGLASTPFNVAVGGTMFSEGSNTPGATPYWSPAGAAPYSTALSYIPEIPWNESAFDIYPNGYGGIVSGGSGISLYYGTPSFQAGPGVPASDPTPNSGTVTGFTVSGPHRYLPDVALQAAGGHDGTIYCSEGSCTLKPDGSAATIGVVGGTSVAAPSMAGVQALINQKNGGRQGNANYFYYRVAATQNQVNCVAATYLTLADATCGFHDIATGNLNIPASSNGSTFVGWSAGPGYDLAVGLGSADAANLATRWSAVTFNATTTAFTLSPVSGLTHGDTQNLTVAVSPVSGTGTPTGDVSIIANAAYGAVGFYTLSGGSATGVINSLPGGTYNVHAHYAGDATYGGSNSAPVTVTIAPEASVLTAQSYLLDTNGGLTSTNSYLYGANVYLDAQVSGASAYGTPTGKVTFSLTRGSTPLAPYTAPLDSFADAYFDAGLGDPANLIMPTAPVLAPGVYTASLAYPGDASFNATTATLPFTITPASQTLNLTAASVEIASGATATFNASIATVSPAAGGVPATGTVAFTDTTTSANLGIATLSSGALVFTTTAIAAAGAHTITAAYSGDPNYLAASSSVTVTVGGAASSLSLSVSPATAPVGTSITLTAALPTGASGTVSFYDNAVSLGSAPINSSTLTAALPIANFAARTHILTATYSGNSTQAAATSSATLLTITQNTPTVQLSAQQAAAGTSTVAMNATLLPSPRGYPGNDPPPTGLVQFLDGATVLGSAPPVYLPGGYNNYVAAFTTQALRPGPHTLTATYLGDPNFASAASNAQTVNIGLTTSTLTSSTTTIGTGGAFTLTDRIIPQVAGASAIGGTVTFSDGTTTLGTASVTGGAATLSTAVLRGIGPHTIAAVYSGDTNFYTSASAPTSITVTQAASTITLTASAATIQAGTTVTLTATAPATSNGTITFLDNGVSLGTAPLSGPTPSASLTISNLAVRTHTLTATYSGDANFLPATSSATVITVTQATSAITLSSSATVIQVGSILTLTAAAPATSTGSIAFLDNGVPLATVPLAGLTPTASLTVTNFAARTHTLTAAYSGDANFLPATSPAALLTVAQNTPTLQLGTLQNASTAAALPLNATLVPSPAGTKPNNPAPTGFLQFSDGVTLLAASPVLPLADGSGNFGASFTTAVLSPGSHTIAATYTGDANYAPAASASQTVLFGSTTTTLNVTPAAPQVGATVTLTASISNPGTGTVTFFDNAVAIGTVPVIAGLAPLAVTNFAAGTHNLTATYSGDARYSTSASTTTILPVARNTPTLQLPALQNASAASALSLNATLVPTPAGAKPNNPPPTGSVQYSDGTAVLGSAPLVVLADGSGNYAARFTTPVLRPGAHSISAAYAGDANYLAALAPAQTVNLGLTTLALTAAATSVGLGTPLVLTAIITPVLPAATTIGGTVAFYDGATVLGTSPVISSAAILTTALAGAASATHTITAVYSGDSAFFPATSSALSITTLTPSVAVSINPPSLTITRGSSGSATITVTTTGNYSGTVTPSCAGLPSLATCAFNAASLTFNGVNATQTIAVTIATTAPTTSSSLLWLPAILLAGIVTLRRRLLTAPARGLLLFAFITIGLVAAMGCGSSPGTATTIITTTTGGTPLGNSTVTLTLAAAGATSASPSAQSTLTLAVTVQ